MLRNSVRLSMDAAALVQGLNAFSCDLYKRLAGEPGNLLFSPASISIALAMTSVGARNKTAQEFASVLHSQLPPEKLHQAFRELREATRTGGIEFRIANRLWVQSGLAILSEFQRTTEREYDATAGIVDFKNSTEQARCQINHWVEQHTARRICDLIPPGAVNEETRAVIANAVYFLGAWDCEFNPDGTRPASFRTAFGEERTVSMMHQEEFFSYGEFDGLQVLELPYRSEDIVRMDVDEEIVEAGGSDFALTILLPRTPDGLAALEAGLSASSLQTWTMLTQETVAVSLPVFRVDSAFFLKEALQPLGMRQAFSRERADFSGLSDDPSGFHVDEVLHKAFIEVNELGTEAAAATAIVMRFGCAMVPKRPKVFCADHPFLFLIRDRKTKLIYFVGRYSGRE